MTQASVPPRAARRRHDREIITLAVPAFGALVAEPLFLMVNTPSSATSAPPNWPVSASLGTPRHRGERLRLPGLRHHGRRGPTRRSRRSTGPPSAKAWTASGSPCCWAWPSSLSSVPTAPTLVTLFGSSDTADPLPRPICGSRHSAFRPCLSCSPPPGYSAASRTPKTPLYVAVAGFVANGALNVRPCLWRRPGHRGIRLGHGHRPGRHGSRIPPRGRDPRCPQTRRLTATGRRWHTHLRLSGCPCWSARSHCELSS